MEKSLNYRPYQPGDEAAILDLFQKSFGRPLSPEFWQWRFAHNPSGDILINLAWDGDVLASHYAVSPIQLTVRGEDTPAVLSMTTMTHPDYRGLGLFPRLADSLYHRAAGQGYALVWGYPNDFSHRGLVRDLGWSDLYEIPQFQIQPGRLRSAPKISPQVVELPVFDDRFDALWQKARTSETIWVKRDAAFLRWRYQDNPQNRYRILGYLEGQELLGYAVYKTYQQDKMDLVDLLALRETPAGLALVEAAVDHARQAGYSLLNLWLPVRHPLHLELEKIGFSNAMPVTYAGARVLGSLPGGIDPLDVRNWYYTMNDSDLY